MPKSKNRRKEPEIVLDRERGVGPHLCICARCGKDTNAIALLGNKDRLCKCPCGVVSLSGPGGRRCPACGQRLQPNRRLGESEKVRAGLCSECEEDERRLHEVVVAGGIYFRCLKCGAYGAIKPESELAVHVRKNHKVKPPNPIGVEFPSCPKCDDAPTGEVGQA